MSTPTSGHTRDQARGQLDALIRAAAAPLPGRRAQEPAARALLERIIAVPRVHDPEAAAVRPPSRRRLRLTGLALGGTAAAAVVAGLAVVPGLSGTPAYASWKATSDPLPPAELKALAAQCIAGAAPLFHDPGASLGAARHVAGEKRGDYAYVVAVMPRWGVTCFRDRDGKVRAGSEFADPLDPARLGTRGIELEGWSGLSTAEGTCRLMAGAVGRDVAAVDILTTDRGTVHATVDGGRFLAWYPESDPSGGAPTVLTLHLRDGRTVPGLSARALMEAPYLG